MERKIDLTLHIRVEPELRERLLELARAEDRPLSNLIGGRFGTWQLVRLVNRLRRPHERSR